MIISDAKQVYDQLGIVIERATKERNTTKRRIKFLEGKGITTGTDHQRLTDRLYTLENEIISIQLNQEMMKKQLKKCGTLGELLSKLKDDKWREEAGFEMAIIAEAVKRLKEKWGEFHEFADGEVDRILISDETVDDEDSK